MVILANRYQTEFQRLRTVNIGDAAISEFQVGACVAQAEVVSARVIILTFFVINTASWYITYLTFVVNTAGDLAVGGI